MTLPALQFGDKPIVYDVDLIKSLRTRVVLLMEQILHVGVKGAPGDAVMLADVAAVLACVVREMGGTIERSAA